MKLSKFFKKVGHNLALNGHLWYESSVISLIISIISHYYQYLLLYKPMYKSNIIIIKDIDPG